MKNIISYEPYRLKELDFQSEDKIVFTIYYVENSSEKNEKEASSEKLRRIYNRVRKVKGNEEFGVKYMQKWEEIAYAKEDGKAEGKAEAVLEILAEYGEVPKDLKVEILSQTDLQKLSGWLKLAARAGGLEEFMEKYQG